MTQYIQRRDKGPSLLPERWRRHYNVWFDDGFGFSVTLQGLDTLLDGSRFPADFRACVQAADELFKAGDRKGVVEWPSGNRSQQPQWRPGSLGDERS